jgi:hypothetical protein
MTGASEATPTERRLWVFRDLPWSLPASLVMALTDEDLDRLYAADLIGDDAYVSVVKSIVRPASGGVVTITTTERSREASGGIRGESSSLSFAPPEPTFAIFTMGRGPAVVTRPKSFVHELLGERHSGLIFTSSLGPPALASSPLLVGA